MLSRRNQAAYPDAYEQLKELTDQGVEVRVCRNAARFRGYQPDDFYDLVTVVPAAMTELARWQAKGYAYISGDVIQRPGAAISGGSIRKLPISAALADQRRSVGAVYGAARKARPAISTANRALASG